MQKAIAHPTDSRLYERARRSLVTLAGKAGIALRQNYNRLAPRLAARVGRHAHARQFRRMRKALRTLKGYTGRILRDVGRKLGTVPEGALRARIEQRIALATRLLRQTPKTPRKLYALHEPAVDCISKGKARVRYEFGVKVSITTTINGGFVVGMRSMPGTPTTATPSPMPCSRWRPSPASAPASPWSIAATGAMAPTAPRCSSAARAAVSHHG